MTVRRTLLPTILGLAVVVGCSSRNQTRRDPLRREAVPASQSGGATTIAAGQQPFTPAAPPAPPPLPLPKETKPTTYVQTQPAAVPPSPSPPTEAPLAQTQNIVPVPPAPPGQAEQVASAGGPIRERIRERIQDRRETRDSSTPKTPTLLPPPSAPEPPPATIPSPPPSAQPVAPVATEDKARQLLDAATKRYAGVPDFEARLVKREVVNGKQLPQDEIAYKFRKQPLSVAMTILSDAGKGREVVFVKGRDDGAMHVVTGKGDNRLVGVGYKTTVDPDGRDATSKSRYRIYEAGFGRTLRGLELAYQRGFTVKALGPVQRSEYPYPLEAVEVTATGPGDPSLPVGAKRMIYFDPKPDSPSYMLPVLTEMRDAAGREIEYYSFDQIKAPAGLTDADFDPARMGKRK